MSLTQEQKELQACCIHAIRIIEPTSVYKPWVESKQIRDLVSRVLGTSTQSVMGALVALQNTRMVKTSFRDGFSWWKLAPATERMIEIYDPSVLMPVLEKINKAAEKESSQYA